MAVLNRGARTPETRKGPHSLSLKTWKPQNTAQRSKNEPVPDSRIANPIQAWESWLLGERNLWDIDQHRLPQDADDWLRGGAWAKRRLSKADAAELLGMAFTAIDRGCQ